MKPTLPERLKPLDTISPSLASKALINDGCLFRILAQSRSNRFETTDMLPVSIDGIIGTVIHKVIEWGYRGGPDGRDRDIPDAFNQWDKIIKEKEQDLSDDKINRHLLPLKDRKSYFKKRGRVCHHANKISKEIRVLEDGTDKSESDMKNRLVGPEISVQDKISDPRMKGRIDLVVSDGEDLEIFDWKTGKILDKEGNLKAPYKNQIRLYAALLECKQKNLDSDDVRFPRRGVIKNPLTGSKEILCEEGLDPDLCRELLKDSINIYEEINETHEKDDDTDFLMDKLAAPSKKGCRYCSIRPRCRPYLKELENWMGDIIEDLDDIEIQDVIGHFVDKHRSGPRSSKGAILLEDDEARRWRIAGIDLDAERNEAIEGLRKGEMVGVFNIYKNTRCDLPEYINLLAYPTRHIVYDIESLL